MSSSLLHKSLQNTAAFMLRTCAAKALRKCPHSPKPFASAGKPICRWKSFTLRSVASPAGAAGKTLDDVAKAWKKSSEDTLMDFVLADKAQTGAIYFMASEEDVHTGLSQPRSEERRVGKECRS